MAMNFVLVIDTEEYSGNFERELTAYATGQIGDCGVGVEEADIANEQLQEAFKEEIEQIIGSFLDEHGVRRPCEIWPTPGWFNNGAGGHFREGDLGAAEEHKKHYYASELAKLPGQLKSWGWQKEASDAEIAYVKERASRLVCECPAYLSVGIAFETKPSTELIHEIVKRAQEFLCRPKKCSPEEKVAEYTGFRLFQVWKDGDMKEI